MLPVTPSNTRRPFSIASSALCRSAFSAGAGGADGPPDVHAKDRGHLLVRLAQEVLRRLARLDELDDQRVPLEAGLRVAHLLEEVRVVALLALRLLELLMAPPQPGLHPAQLRVGTEPLLRGTVPLDSRGGP